MDGLGTALQDQALVDNSEVEILEKDKAIKTSTFETSSIDKNYNDLKQNERGIRVIIDRRRDENLTVFGKATLSDRYLMPDEDYQDLFARVALHYSDNSEHAQRIYNYMSQHWFMPSTPILSNLSLIHI